LTVSDGGADVDEDAEAYENHSRPYRDTCALCGEVGFGCAKFPQEESEAAHGKTYAHQGKPGSNPGEEGSFGREVYPWILLYGLVHEEL
jgi:hypothetical protein